MHAHMRTCSKILAFLSDEERGFAPDVRPHMPYIGSTHAPTYLYTFRSVSLY